MKNQNECLALGDLLHLNGPRCGEGAQAESRIVLSSSDENRLLLSSDSAFLMGEAVTRAREHLLSRTPAPSEGQAKHRALGPAVREHGPEGAGQLCPELESSEGQTAASSVLFSLSAPGSEPEPLP